MKAEVRKQSEILTLKDTTCITCRVSHQLSDTIARTRPLLSDQIVLYLYALLGTSVDVSKPLHKIPTSTRKH